MKRIEKLGIGELKICFKPLISEVSGDKIYPKKTVIIHYCSRNNARNDTEFLRRENGGEISKIYWNGKLIEHKDLKIIHRAIAA